MVFAAHRKPIVSGAEEMVGSIGQVLDDFTNEGRVHIHGETWNVRSRVPLKRGDPVRVIDMDGLVLVVERVEEGMK